MIMTAALRSVPEWHNPAAFIAWIEANISPRPQQRYPSGFLIYTLG